MYSIIEIITKIFWVSLFKPLFYPLTKYWYKIKPIQRRKTRRKTHQKIHNPRSNLGLILTPVCYSSDSDDYIYDSKGFSEGRTEGHTVGFTEGHIVGFSEGRTVGFSEGLDKGRHEVMCEIYEKQWHQNTKFVLDTAIAWNIHGEGNESILSDIYKWVDERNKIDLTR